MGLLIGASTSTITEVLGLIIYNFFLNGWTTRTDERPFMLS